jgi:indolepyruvate ferredoxin oxidoreductase alpha subunit
MLLPAFARKNYAALIEKQKVFLAWSEEHAAKNLELNGGNVPFSVISSGLGGNYYEENLPDIKEKYGSAPSRLHIESYPLPLESIRKLLVPTAGTTDASGPDTVLVIEEGQPFIEERLRGILPQTIRILGRLPAALVSGASAGSKTPLPAAAPPIPRTGELDPDNVRTALGLPPRKSVLDGLSSPAAPETTSGPLGAFGAQPPGRPPQLCAGCPHADTYETINKAAAALDSAPNHPSVSVSSDIGCYSLGASPPYSAIESIVCMGASIGMARGASDAGIPYALAVIGDSTFIHSGLTALIDAVQANTPMTLCILDNSIVAMTGCQPTALPSEKLRSLILGTGIDPSHVLELDTRKQNIEENSAKLKKEAEYRGLSIVVFKRECLEAARKRLKAKK